MDFHETTGVTPPVFRLQFEGIIDMNTHLTEDRGIILDIIIFTSQIVPYFLLCWFSPFI